MTRITTPATRSSTKAIASASLGLRNHRRQEWKIAAGVPTRTDPAVSSPRNHKRRVAAPVTAVGMASQRIDRHGLVSRSARQQMATICAKNSPCRNGPNPARSVNAKQLVRRVRDAVGPAAVTIRSANHQQAAVTNVSMA